MKDVHMQISLDLNDPWEEKPVRVRRGDTAKVLVIRLKKDKDPWPVPPDSLAVFTARKPDRTVLYNICEIREGVIFYPFTEQTVSCPGPMDAELKIYGGNRQLLTSAGFRMEVYDTLYQAEDAAKSQDEQNTLNALINQTLDVKNSTETLRQGVQGRLDRGELQGETAYEIAHRLGFQGTEQQWLDSLRYDHSEEFIQLANQVRQDLTEARSAAQAAAGSAEAAKTDMAAAIQAAQTATSQAGAAKGEADRAKKEADRAAESAGKSVSYEPQSLTPEQQKQARENTKAASEEELEMVKHSEIVKSNPADSYSRIRFHIVPGHTYEVHNLSASHVNVSTREKLTGGNDIEVIAKALKAGGNKIWKAGKNADYVLVYFTTNTGSVTIEDIATDVYQTDAKLSQFETNLKDLDALKKTDLTVTAPMADGQWIKLEDGKQYGSADFGATDFIELSPTCFKVEAKMGTFSLAAAIAFYDAEKVYIKEGSIAADEFNHAVSLRPEGAKYVRFTTNGGKVPIKSAAYKFVTLERIAEIEDKVKKLEEGSTDWTNKKWACVGDSITDAAHLAAATHYWGYIKADTGITINNCGVSGSGYVARKGEGKNVASNIAELLDLDCNAITIMCGINDAAWFNYELGTYNDHTDETIAGGINLAIDAVEAKYGLYAPLGLISPPPADVVAGIYPSTINPKQYPKEHGCRLELLTNMLQEIAKYRGYPFLDLFHTSRLQPQKQAVKELYYKNETNQQVDGLHLNSRGHGVIYQQIKKFVGEIMI